MPIIETCGVCGLDLHFVPGFKDGQGQYFHIFESEKAGWYKAIHLPVPAIQDEIFGSEKPEVFFPTQGWSGQFRKVSA